MLPIVKIRMFDIHKDIWSIGFQFILVHIHFNIILSFEIQPKQGNGENINQLKVKQFSKNKDKS